jgi:hypothetical protein
MRLLRGEWQIGIWEEPGTEIQEYSSIAGLKELNVNAAKHTQTYDCSFIQTIGAFFGNRR